MASTLQEGVGSQNEVGIRKFVRRKVGLEKLNLTH